MVWYSDIITLLLIHKCIEICDTATSGTPTLLSGFSTRRRFQLNHALKAYEWNHFNGSKAVWRIDSHSCQQTEKEVNKPDNFI